ncbi:hypothetical protein EV668_3612 [Enterovirga rhinocerotis]|uniref:Uncharacterized protein n=1 Tax=Enterovirga rhinocerotis TaxID=1339210 RepID=A0A4R7BTP9_9HYPH|nr:hypothetical protein EV668_3612 [Enterovirga rhinocerotis]
MGRRKERRSTFTPDSISNVVDRMMEEGDRRRAGQLARHAPKPVTVATGKWVRCPKCADVRQRRPGCTRCRGSGDIPERMEVWR